MVRPQPALAAVFALSLAVSELPVEAATRIAQAIPAPFPSISPPANPQAIPTVLQPGPLPSVPSVAPGYAAPQLSPPPGGLVGVTQTPFVGLRLEDAITMALMKNTDLAVAQENRRIAAFQIVAAKGAYDLQFQIAPSYTHQVQPPISALEAGPNGGPVVQDSIGASASVSGTVPQTGTQITFGASGQRITNNSVVNSFNPYYFSSLSVQVNQPLLRGFATDQTRRQIQLAQVNRSLADDSMLLTATNTVAAVENAYWDLVGAWRNVAIQEQSLQNAVAQAQTTQRQASAGTQAPISVTEANSQVALYQGNLFAALQNVQTLQNQLKSLILSNPSDPIWTANLVPTSIVGEAPPEPNLADVIAQALRNRPEIAQLADERRSADIMVAYARDQLKPSVNLQLGYTSTGFAGWPTAISANPIFSAFGGFTSSINQLIANNNAAGFPPVSPIAPLNFAVPPYTSGGFGTSVYNLFANRFPTYSAQLNIQFPIGNDVAKGNYGVALEQRRSVDVNQVALIERIKAEASDAVQTLREARAQLIAARNQRETAQAVYDSELRKYAAGTSTTFLVLQRQLTLSNAEAAELNAQTALNKAIVRLQQVTGTILAANGFDVKTAGTGALDGLPAALQANPTLPTPAPSGAP
jgi:outer membrane protein TolC